jgi:hypothetical protein
MQKLGRRVWVENSLDTSLIFARLNWSIGSLRIWRGITRKGLDVSL